MICYCERCRRRVLEENLVIVDGHGYGRDCAPIVGDLFTQPAQREQSRTRRRRARAGQNDLFASADVRANA